MLTDKIQFAADDISFVAFGGQRCQCNFYHWNWTRMTINAEYLNELEWSLAMSDCFCLLIASVVNNGDINFRARWQTVADDTLFADCPRCNHHRQFLVVGIQTFQAFHVTVNRWRCVRHQVARAIAYPHLFVLATLHQTGTVAVIMVHVKNVLIAEATVSLLHTDVTR